MMNLAPIILFVYNRPRHTRQTIEALKKNEWAQESRLMIYADGPQDEHQIESVKSVRKYIHAVDGFKHVTIQESDLNLGLANSIVTGVTHAVDTFGKAIILEDDIVTSPFFLRYMNEALTIYEHMQRVMHVSGFMIPIKPDGLSSCIFTRLMFCWGWATWKDRWRLFDRDSAHIIESFSSNMIAEFNISGHENIWRQILENHAGTMETWAVFWYASIFLNDGLCLNPSLSYTRNIGTDNSGTHSGQSLLFRTKLARQPAEIKTMPAILSTLAQKRIEAFYQRKNFFPVKYLDLLLYYLKNIFCPRLHNNR